MLQTRLTKDGFKGRQLHIEDYLCVIPAERGRETGVPVHQRITGGDDIITDFWTKILARLGYPSMLGQYLKVCENL